MLNLGAAYNRGMGVPKSFAEAARWYMRTMGCTASMDAGTCFKKNSDLGIYVSDAPSALPNDQQGLGDNSGTRPEKTAYVYLTRLFKSRNAFTENQELFEASSSDL